ncbi:MAG: hypothetical protein IT305_21505 [Chloroflexi bacterium]|nr:hypothetical protein [Chloroflexota bacterium]
MSQAAVAEILGRALREREFSARLDADASAVLADFDLTDDERAAILAGLERRGAAARLCERPRNATRLV